MNHCDRATITTKRAAEILCLANHDMGLLSLQAGIEQEKLPFGICIQQSRRVFYVYKTLFADWVLKYCGVKLIFDGELVRLIFSDGTLKEIAGEDGEGVVLAFDAIEPVQVAV